MAKTSQYSVIDPLEVSLGRPITADLLLAISKLVNHAGTPGEEHITCALGSDGWTFPVDSAGNEAGAASSEGPCPVQVAKRNGNDRHRHRRFRGSRRTDLR